MPSWKLFFVTRALKNCRGNLVNIKITSHRISRNKPNQLYDSICILMTYCIVCGLLPLIVLHAITGLIWDKFIN